MDAKIARLQVQLEIEQQESATRIRELEQKVTNLKVEVTDLKVENRLSAAKPKGPAPEHTAPTGSSDPVLQTEISRLQQELASKDAEIASKDAEIASKDVDIASKDADIKRLCRKHSDLMKSMTSYDHTLSAMSKDLSAMSKDLSAMSQDIRRNVEATAAVIGDLHREESTPKVGVTDTDRSSNPASSSPPKDAKDEGETESKTPSSNSAPKDVKGEGETKPKAPSFSATPIKVRADAAPALPETAKPNYSQVLQALITWPDFPKGTVPPVTARGDFFGRRTGQQQAVFNPFKQQPSVQRDTSPKYETQKRRADQSGREDRRPEKGLKSHHYPPKVHYPLTPRLATNQKAMSANAKEDTRDQLLRKTDVNLSVATSKLQIGQEGPICKVETGPSRVDPEIASYIANTPGMMLDNQGNHWHVGNVEFGIRIGSPIPPEVLAAYESGALQVPKKKAFSGFGPWVDPWQKSVNPPAPKPETREAGPSKAELEGDKVVPKPEQPAVPDGHKSSSAPAQKLETGDPNLIETSSLSVKKRLADEEQPGTRAPVKRRRST